MNLLATKTPPPGHTTTSYLSSRIEAYYRETIEDYQCWSPKGYMHFGLWDRKLNPFNRESMLERANDHLFDLLRLDELQHSCIGDFGCGLGAVTRYGAARFPQHSWIGLNLSAEQVAWAKQHSSMQSSIKQPFSNQVPHNFANRDEDRENHCCQTIHATSGEVICADYHQTPFADQSLGAIFFLESLCHSSDILKSLSEAFRVLEPGRRVVIVDGMMKRSEQQLASHVKWLMKETCRNWAVPQFYCLQDILSAAEACGFKVLRADDLSWAIAPSVIHSPWLIARRALTLMIRKWTSRNRTPSPWQWRHLRACLLGMILGMNRKSFGYYSIVLEREINVTQVPSHD